MFSTLHKPTSIAPLITFRILFGILCFFGLLWSVAKNELAVRYWTANFYFKYWGFEWLPYPGDIGIVILYILAMISALGISFGAFYRLSVLLFALSFSYLHTVDASNFINHYYLIWIFAFYLFFVPANAALSIDSRMGWVKKRNEIPYMYLLVFLLQIGIVYTYAGIAKLNSDWIFRAMPLKIWLGQSADFPIIGGLFSQNWVHFAMSWFAAFYDLTIVFWLLRSKSRPYAYVAVLVFHLLTSMLFDIGLFPPLMIIACTLFFSPAIHVQFLSKLGYRQAEPLTLNTKIQNPKILILSFFLLIQLFLPVRHWFLTKENILWTQDYYRYGWRLMLVENEGFASFTVCDANSNRFWVVDNNEYLTPYQIKRMSVQPEHIRQFAHYIAKLYARKYGLINPIVNADVFVTLNGRPSKRLIDPKVNLAAVKKNWQAKDWILE
jgi:hypothetical protein